MVSAKELGMDVAVVTVWSKLTGVFADKRTALKAFFPLLTGFCMSLVAHRPQTIAVCHWLVMLVKRHLSHQ